LEFTEQVEPDYFHSVIIECHRRVVGCR
jgi:hypothetical protein